MASTVNGYQSTICNKLDLHSLHSMHSQHLHLFMLLYSIFIALSYCLSCAIRLLSRKSVNKLSDSWYLVLADKFLTENALKCGTLPSKLLLIVIKAP